VPGTNTGETPLFYAIRALRNDDMEGKKVVEALVDHGASLKAVRNGLTPLHYACQYPNVEVVRYLAELCGIHGPEGKGNTPLLIATSAFNTPVFNLLIELYASPIQVWISKFSKLTRLRRSFFPQRLLTTAAAS
jgi:ankyrin repeat protein